MASFADSTPLASPVVGKSPSRQSHFRSSPAKKYAPGQPRFNKTMKENEEHYSDRFIPSRLSSRIEPGFSLLDDSQYSDMSPYASGSADGGGDGTSDGGASKQPMLNRLLRSELLGIDCASNDLHMRRTDMNAGRSAEEAVPSQPNVFKFKTPLENIHDRDPRSVYDLSPVKGANKGLLLSPNQKEQRKICKVPFKVLDAPALQDDFYLNLVDW